ncbi:MAG: N-6 DNA methylase [Spirochaetes bacterium]|nr:N-6 DNA methylase [Spirochaetota bacterium]
MNYPSIRIEGSILSHDLLDRLERGDLRHQDAKDFGFDHHHKVKDRIAEAWAAASAHYKVFQSRISGLKPDETGTTETRRHFGEPFFSLLDYTLVVQKAGESFGDRNYLISHRDETRDGFPVHIVGANDSLDKKRDSGGGARISPHALLQEYLNLTEHTYGLVTNGRLLRLLRDSTRLIRLSYLEVDLERMFGEELYADFAALYRLIHASRMPKTRADEPRAVVIEQYHQDSLDDGGRIRDRLSEAVARAMELIGCGLLAHPMNEKLREQVKAGNLTGPDLYRALLKLIYRVLFMMVIEERGLIYPEGTPQRLRELYRDFYSVGRLRQHAMRRRSDEKQNRDLWVTLRHTFRLFENAELGAKLGLKPLGGDLFRPGSLELLENAELDNASLMEAFSGLGTFQDTRTGAWVRVNYGALNVEEFGSVYEGLLDYSGDIKKEGNGWAFALVKGSERGATGSHYTPEELVQPLIRHSLDHVINEKLALPDKAQREAGLLSIAVCDPACGSGHVLLSVARRIAAQVAKVRTGEDQPSPPAFRAAMRDVIARCLYGVDKNPMAVELCKIALWLEGHSPGEPLEFLDHRIRCGDSICGIRTLAELVEGIPEAAFDTSEEDDKDVAKALRKKHADEVKARKTGALSFGDTQGALEDLSTRLAALEAMPEHSPAEVDTKQKAWQELVTGPSYARLKAAADTAMASFFTPKTEANRNLIATEKDFRAILDGRISPPVSQFAKAASTLTGERRFFHWFLEFPEVKDGFDVVIGNPPFLGGQRIRGANGIRYLDYMRHTFAPAGSIDMVAYFFRRAFDLISPNRLFALIATNTVAQGAAREGGLEVIEKNGGTINFAVRSTPWPGVAAVEVALAVVNKGTWPGKKVLDGKEVQHISSFFDDQMQVAGNPHFLLINSGKSFQGSIVLGDGFVMEPEEAQRLIKKTPKNSEVIQPYMNGEDLNSRPEQNHSRYVINFYDWPLERAKAFPEVIEILEEKVRPVRELNNREIYKRLWWQYAEKRPALYRTISGMSDVLGIACQAVKYVSFSYLPANCIYSNALTIIALNSDSDFAVLHSCFHSEWAWKNSSTMKGDLRYASSACFETFPFPDGLNSIPKEISYNYRTLRHKLMSDCRIGITTVYNLFHKRSLDFKTIVDFSKHLRSLQSPIDSHESPITKQAVEDIKALRRLHTTIDEAVLNAYGWHQPGPMGPAIQLRHDFYDVEYLPENDRVRYTIHPEARREVLKRLLALNHERHRQEVAEGLMDENDKPTAKGKAILAERMGKAGKDDGEDGGEAEAVVGGLGEAKVKRGRPAGKKGAGKKEDGGQLLMG